ncbi:MAG: M48 family metallopeptidase [Rhodocyclales bacterium]|nr:M48 family metallopeptidase [Rhodocyclales bacterium]
MLSAVYYDGRSALRHPVRLHVGDDCLHLDGDSVRRSVPLGSVDFGEAMGKGPRCIELPDGARCEVADHDGMRRLLAAAGVTESLVVRLQTRWRWAAAALAIVVGSAGAAYFWGLPALARTLAPHVPAPAVKLISDGVLAQLDGQLFAASALPPARQDEIRRLATAHLREAGQPDWRIHFRSAPKIGANALALPGGDIVILDKLVTLMNDDRQLLAVVAHEVGHLAHRHSLQQLIQGATLSLVLAAWFGDVSSAAVALGGQLLQAGYSREAEREADAYATRLLLRCCGSSAGLVEALEKLARSEGDAGGALSLLGSHPETAARIAAIRALAAQGN